MWDENKVRIKDIAEELGVSSVTALVLGAVSRKKQKNHNAFALIQNIDILYFI